MHIIYFLSALATDGFLTMYFMVALHDNNPDIDFIEWIVKSVFWPVSSFIFKRKKTIEYEQRN